jgi:hypothetical protein
MMGTNERKWWEDAVMAVLGIIGAIAAMYMAFYF